MGTLVAHSFFVCKYFYLYKVLYKFFKRVLKSYIKCDKISILMKGILGLYTKFN